MVCGECLQKIHRFVVLFPSPLSPFYLKKNLTYLHNFFSRNDFARLAMGIIFLVRR